MDAGDERKGEPTESQVLLRYTPLQREPHVLISEAHH